MIKRFDVVMGCSEKGIYEEECVRHTDHAAEVARLEEERDAALARSHAALVKQQERTRKARKQRDEAQKQAGELAEALRKIYS